MRTPETQEVAAASNRRQKHVINPRFQWRFAGMIASVVFLGSALMSFILYGLLHGQARMRAMSPTTYGAEVTLVMLGFGLGFAVLAAGGFGAWSFVLTHRICGPLFVLERFISELGRGRIPKVRPLRKKDEFKDLYATFTDTVDTLKAQKLADLATLTKAVDCADATETSDEAACREALREITNELEKMRGEIADAVGVKPPARGCSTKPRSTADAPARAAASVT